MIKDELIENLKGIFKNYNVFLVGGYVRNYLINNEISLDRDLVTTDDAKQLALDISKYYNATFIVLDEEYEIYRVCLKDKKNYFDISKALENDIDKDIKRRDFTINSIFYDLNNEKFYDPLGGIKDIENKKIKTYDLNNLLDDPLRILRLYRFLSFLNFEVEERLNDFAKKNFDLIYNCAFERINQEILKLFEGEYVSETLLKMYDDEVLQKLFPFVDEIKKIPSNTHHHLDLIHHSIETVKNIRINKPELKLAAFMHDIGKPRTWTIEPLGRHRFIGHDLKGYDLAKEELKRLKFPKKKTEFIARMVRFHIYPATLINENATKKAFARFVKKLGDDAPYAIELSRADRLSARGVAITDEIIEKALKHLENLLNYYNEVKMIVKKPARLLNGNEIMQVLNIKQSKKLGEIIDALYEAQLEKRVQSKEEAIEFIKKYKK